MVQYGAGPTVYRIGFTSSRNHPAVHTKRDCKHLKGVENVFEKPWPSLACRVEDESIPTCSECFDPADIGLDADELPAEVAD